ncbi:unnamed protein product [Peniophora sp. CBMAI 1063]|nr:unnamed protein product [Peniophora sp. CBMAI 1063]
MLLNSIALVASFLAGSVSSVTALGSSCTAALGSGSAAAGDPYWQESITHQGTAPYAESGYKVFRNVKDYGAVGDGVHDDTSAINAAITDGDRCGSGCAGTTLTPATVYFPQGTYLVSAPLIAYYYTELVGDAKVLPTLKASASFAGIAVIDVDPYIDGGNGAEWYVNQNNFYRSVRNFRIDLTAAASSTGLHWQLSQATSLYNIVFDMTTGGQQQGIYMENGSGGFMGDLVFNGGKYGAYFGNQQFTARNLTFNNANTAVYANWNWGWTFQGLTINNAQVGFEVNIGDVSGTPQGVGAEAIIDAVVTNTPVFLQRTKTQSTLDGSIVLSNIKLTSVPTAVGVDDGTVLLAGGTTTIDTWIQGNVFSGSSSTATYTTGSAAAINKPSSLLDSGRIFSKGRPTYANYAVSEFVSVKDEGAKGDATTDDTAALQAVFDKYAGCKIIYFDAGIYIVSSTLKIPAGVQIVGEAWTTIMGSGDAFSSIDDPSVVVQVGTEGSTGIAEISSILFTTRAPAGGAILVEWNVHDPSGNQGAAGMWDTLFRLGGAKGTNMQTDQCGNLLGANTSPSCQAAFLGLHLTKSSSAYLESTWVWLADHDVEGGTNVTLFSGRGILSESQGPVWLIGTASEHHVLYQYNIANAANHYIGLAQTETAYFQPTPKGPTPFTVESAYSDPDLPSDGMGWGMNIVNSKDILIFGAGFYSWYDNYDGSCVTPLECQTQMFNIDSASTDIGVYSLNTVGTSGSLSVNGAVVIQAAPLQNGLSNTATVWTSS